MNVSDITAIVSAAAAAAGFGLATYQAVAARRTRRSAEEKIAELRTIVSSALTQVRAAADAADAIVQRAKAQATPAEVASLGRVARAQLMSLARELTRQLGRRDRWTVGAARQSGGPDVPVDAG